MVNPTLWVELDGSWLSCATTTDRSGRTVLADDRPTIVDELSIVWGREDVWTQPDPSVLTLTLWEPASTATWLAKIVAHTALRRSATVQYGIPPSDDPYQIFRGYTTNVDATPERRRTRKGITDGWRIRVQASDRSGFIGQDVWGPGTLPEETMINRAVRIRNRAVTTGIREVYFEARFQSGQVKPLDVGMQTVAETMNGMYQSFADQWTYIPSRNVVNRIPGGSNWAPYSLRFGRSNSPDPVANNTIRLYPPAWVDPTGAEDPQDTAAYPAGYIGACSVASDITLSANAIQEITHIKCNWYDKPNAKDWSTTVQVRAGNPRNLLEFDSWYNNGIYVDPIIDDVEATVLAEGGRPVHPQIRWNTKVTGEIPDWPTFKSLTLPAQTVRMVTLAGSPYSAATGYAPVWHPCGGVITYRDGEWDIAVNLSPTNMPLPAGFTPVTCATIHQSITLADPNAWHIDRSVTPFDLRFVGPGDTVYLYS